MSRIRLIHSAMIIGICIASSPNVFAQNLRGAIQLGDIQAIEKAVEADPDLLKARDDSTAIWALRVGQTAAAKKLIELGANVNAKDQQGRSVLHWAVMRRDNDYLQMIIDKGAELEAKDNNKYTPLAMSLYYGNPVAAKKLIEAGCELKTKDNQGMTPLHIAMNRGNRELSQLLIDKECDLFAKNKAGVTPYMLACQSGQLEIVKKYFEVEKANQLSSNGQSCLYFATYSSNTQLVEFLCERVDLINKADDSGQTPLSIASANNNLQMVQLLLKHKANPNLKPKQSYVLYPLLSAASYANPEIVQALVDAGANVDVKNQEGNQSLHLVCQSVVPSFGGVTPEKIKLAKKTIQILLDAKANPNAINNAKRTPLEIAVQSNFPAAIDLLIRRTKNIEIDMGRDSFLHWACQNEMPNAVAVLLERDTSKINSSDGQGQTPLCIAALNGSVPIVKSLLGFGADVNRVGDDGLAPIHAAVANKPPVLNNVNGPGGFGRQPQAAQQDQPKIEPKSPEVLMLLVEAGADLTLADGSGRMPLHAAAWHGNIAAIKLFAAKSVNMTPITQAGSTPLHLASWQNHLEAAEVLLALGAPVNRADSDGWTSLHKAALRGNLEMVKLLLKNGADKTVVDSLGLSAYDKAGGKNKESVERLLKFKSPN